LNQSTASISNSPFATVAVGAGGVVGFAVGALVGVALFAGVLVDAGMGVPVGGTLIVVGVLGSAVGFAADVAVGFAVGAVVMSGPGVKGPGGIVGGGLLPQAVSIDSRKIMISPANLLIDRSKFD
jgi:hypothetical protein